MIPAFPQNEEMCNRSILSVQVWIYICVYCFCHNSLSCSVPRSSLFLPPSHLRLLHLLHQTEAKSFNIKGLGVLFPPFLSLLFHHHWHLLIWPICQPSHAHFQAAFCCLTCLGSALTEKLGASGGTQRACAQHPLKRGGLHIKATLHGKAKQVHAWSAYRSALNTQPFSHKRFW